MLPGTTSCRGVNLLLLLLLLLLLCMLRALFKGGFRPLLLRVCVEGDLLQLLQCGCCCCQLLLCLLQLRLQGMDLHVMQSSRGSTVCVSVLSGGSLAQAIAHDRTCQLGLGTLLCAGSQHEQVCV